MTGSRVAVVGGGVLGMVLALRLRSLGHQVTLFEGAAAPGGLAASAGIGGFTWDRFYHVIAPGDLNLLALLDELGLGARIRWGNTRTGFFVDGRLHSMSSTVEFLKFPPLSWVDKLRLGLTILRASRIRDGRPLEEIPATEWLERWSGPRTMERIWRPLLMAKLGEHYHQASAAFIWAIVARMYAARRTGLKRERFGYVDGGYAVVLGRLSESLEASGVELRAGVRVARVEDTGSGAAVATEGEMTRDFDRAVLTVPATRIPALCPDLTEVEKARLGGVVYQGVVCASVLLKRPLAGFYVTNITDGWVPFTAVIEMTALVDRARFGGHSLVYLPRYLSQQDHHWERSDDDLRVEFLAALGRMYPDFRADDVVAFRVSRARDVLAVPTLRYSQASLPPTRTSLPHVFIANSAQIVNGTLNLNETVGLAEAKARELAPLLRPVAAPATEVTA